MAELKNEMHEEFAHQYVLNGGNAAAAARHVGVMAHPASRGSDLLHRKDVRARVEELSGSLPVRLAHRVGSATLQDLQAAISKLIALGAA